jgi:hypothetical protein
MVKLVALVPGRYGASKCEVGNIFEASSQYARIWVALGKAALASDKDGVNVQAIAPAALAKPEKHREASASNDASPPAPAAAGDQDDLEALRCTYLDLTGSSADRRWSVRTLQDKIAEARGIYSRRDMTARDPHDFG